MFSSHFSILTFLKVGLYLLHRAFVWRHYSANALQKKQKALYEMINENTQSSN